jgi:hypothetical protein
MELRYLTPTYLQGDEARRSAACGYVLPEWEVFHQQARLVPWYAFRFALLNRFVSGWLPAGVREVRLENLDDGGWAAWPWDHPTPEQRRAGTEHARRPFEEVLRNFQLGAAPCRALHETLADCRRRGIPAALVLMPEGKDFRSLYPPRVWRRIQTFLARLSRQSGAPLINARRWNGEEDFQDSHHLLPEGAARFTARLGSDFLVPFLRSRGRGDRPQTPLAFLPGPAYHRPVPRREASGRAATGYRQGGPLFASFSRHRLFPRP